ncbi:MAG: immune inhibitor A, partial [Thermoplasmata archaeon]|nr:immune inhibitor A [Thermoplasmata archaeon]
AADQWQYIWDANRAHRGNGVWWNGNPSTGYFSGGIDNSLITRPIDLTNAKNATLSAYFRFNINWGVGGSGRPPDGFRVEVSSDNGVTWQPICLGVRSGWNVSGTEGTQPGMPPGTSYTGITETGDKAYWVPAKSLYRLNVDLSGWRGSVVLLRFRVVTNSTLPNHYAQPISTVGFGGLYIDDIKVFGETIIHGIPQARTIVSEPAPCHIRTIDQKQPCAVEQPQQAEVPREVNSNSGTPNTSGSFYSIPFIASTILAAPCTRTSQQGRPKSLS